MASIYDIAKIAGVSAMTVSNVLNGRGRFSEATRENVMRIAAEQGYFANANAQSLRAKRTNTVGILTPDVSNAFFSTIVLEIESAMHDRGYSSFICSAAYDVERTDSYIQELRRRNVDGLFIVGSMAPSSFASVGRVPCALVDYGLQDLPEQAIVIRNDFLALCASQVACLTRSGCEHVAVVLANPGLRSELGRALAGSFVAAAGHDPNVDARTLRDLCEPEVVKFLESSKSESHLQSNEEAIAEFFEESPQIDGIAALGDRLALIACREAREHGRTPGRDLRIIGADNSNLSQIHNPAVSTVERNSLLMARAAVGGMMAMLEGREPAERGVTIPHEVIERETTLG